MNILMNRPIAALLLCTLSFAIATPSPVEDNDDTDPSQTNNFFFRFFLGDGEGANIYNQMDMNSERGMEKADNYGRNVEKDADW